MKKSTRKMIQALGYIVFGMVTMVTMMYCIIAMYFSGTFLAGHHTTRLVLYVIMFVILVAAMWFWVEGAKYIHLHVNFKNFKRFIKRLR